MIENDTYNFGKMLVLKFDPRTGYTILYYYLYFKFERNDKSLRLKDDSKVKFGMSLKSYSVYGLEKALRQIRYCRWLMY